MKPGQNVRNYVVSVSLENDNPAILGPYTRRAAEQIAAAINRREERRTDDERLGDFLHATALWIKNPGPRGAVAWFFGAGSGRDA